MAKNIINKYIELNKKELNSYMRLIFKDNYKYDFIESFTNEYVKIRYYNFKDDMDLTFRQRLIPQLKELKENLMKENVEDQELIERIYVMYIYILRFDTITYNKDIRITISKFEKICRKTLKKEFQNFQEEFYNIYTKYENEKNEIINSLDSKEFILKISNYSIKNVYRVNIEYNIRFPEIYSKIAIQRAFDTGITNEDKLMVEYYLICQNIIKDIQKGNFDKHYILELAPSIIPKKKKLNSLLSIIDNQLTQEKISLKIKYSEFQIYKEDVYELMRDGFKIAIILDDKFIPNYDNLEKLSVFSYIILNQKLKRYDEIIENKVILNNLIEI